MTCSIEGCNRPKHCKNMCTLHYNRMKKHGDPHKVSGSRWHPVDKSCSIEGCSRIKLAKELCGTHYRRKRIHGDPSIVLLKIGAPISERFWDKVDKNGPTSNKCPELGPCWVWTAGSFSDGYGCFGLNSKDVRPAHRFAYEDQVGKIPEGLTIDHLCLNIKCVRPSHLEPVTNSENVKRSWMNQRRG